MGFRSVFATVLALLMQACGALTTTINTPAQNAEVPVRKPTTTNTPAQNAEVPVRTLIEAMAAGDAARIRAQFSPSATQAYGRDGSMKSPAETVRWLETDIIARNGKVTDPKFSVNGNEVVVRGQYSARGYSSKADFLFTVDNGLIISWRMRY